MDAGNITVPSGYDPMSALKQAGFILSDLKDKNGNYALNYCDASSIKDSLRKMVTRGLYPDNHQCAFIMRGKKVMLQDQYQGNLAVAKRDAGLKRYPAQIVWKGDEFDYDINESTGDAVIKKHKPKIENVTGKMDDMVAAYCVLTFNDGYQYVEIMSLPLIKKAWDKSSNTSLSEHKNFPDQFAKKTVYNRALKYFKDTNAGGFDADSHPQWSGASEAEIQDQQEAAPEWEAPENNTPDKQAEVVHEASEQQEEDKNTEPKAEPAAERKSASQPAPAPAQQAQPAQQAPAQQGEVPF